MSNGLEDHLQNELESTRRALDSYVSDNLGMHKEIERLTTEVRALRLLRDIAGEYLYDHSDENRMKLNAAYISTVEGKHNET